MPLSDTTPSMLVATVEYNLARGRRRRTDARGCSDPARQKRDDVVAEMPSPLAVCASGPHPARSGGDSYSERSSRLTTWSEMQPRHSGSINDAAAAVCLLNSADQPASADSRSVDKTSADTAVERNWRCR